MYIPSDFFASNFTWQEAFPLHHTLGLGNSCSFHVMSKDVEPLLKNGAILEPSDANYKYSAKVKYCLTYYHCEQENIWNAVVQDKMSETVKRMLGF